MRIGELAGKAGVDVQTVRYYEREGLIGTPGRTPSGYRSYRAGDLERLVFIRHCRSLDMPLADIRRLIELSGDKSVSCEEVDGLLHAHLARVRSKLAALQDLEKQLAALDAQCSAGQRVADCGILEELIRAAHGEACACHPVGADSRGTQGIKM